MVMSMDYGIIKTIIGILISCIVISSTTHPMIVSSNPETEINQIPEGSKILGLTGKLRLMKLFVIARKDLSHSQRAVQAGHALAAYLLHSPNFRWKNETLIYLGVKGLRQLENLKRKLELHGITYTEFREPDLNNEVTAIASDQDCKIFSKMNLL
jgi:hypothetical protein